MSPKTIDINKLPPDKRDEFIQYGLLLDQKRIKKKFKMIF